MVHKHNAKDDFYHLIEGRLDLSVQHGVTVGVVLHRLKGLLFISFCVEYINIHYRAMHDYQQPLFDIVMHFPFGRSSSIFILSCPLSQY